MADTWDETRIAELRRISERAQVTLNGEFTVATHLDAVLEFDGAVRPRIVLSLLDELVSVRRERDALVRAVEKHAESMAIECMLGVSEWDSCVPSHLRESFFAAYRSIHPEWQ